MKSIVHGTELTPGMAELLQRIQRVPTPPFHRRTPQEARQVYERAAEVLDMPRAQLPWVEELVLPRRDGGGLRARRYSARPAHTAARLPTVLYLHGGGFTIGSLETHDSLCRQLALRSGGQVVAIDYRLAPEHRFPTAVHDVEDALQSLVLNADEWKVDAARLVVAGDSAGGTLAAVAALLARDREWPLAGQLLITPGTTAHADTDSHRRYAEGYLLDAQTIQWFFAQYIAEQDREDWRFAPLRADHLEGVAPCAVLLAECDPLVDEGLAYADRLRMAGVTVELELVRGVVHDFIKMGRTLPQASAAQDWCAQMLRQFWGDEHG